MKKQIFILILALMTSVTVAWGQGAIHDSNPNTTDCVTDALHPAPGTPYGYQLTATPGGGQYTWWATKDQTFISTVSGTTTTTDNFATRLTTVADLIATSGNYGTPTSGAGADVVTITWSSSILANTKINTNPTFIVGYYEANGVAGICADNLKIYQLDPKNSFIVDIKSFDDASFATSLAYGVNSETQCFDVVRGATWNATQVEYDYGTNYLYYEVVAANFSQEWKPEFLLTGQAATQSVTIQWTYDKPSSWTAGVPATGWHADTETATTTSTDTSVGVSIYVKVTVKNNNYQGITDMPLTLAVAGQNKEGLWDVGNIGCAQPTDFATASADDTVIQTINLRPTIVPGTSSIVSPNITIAPSNAVPQP